MLKIGNNCIWNILAILIVFVLAMDVVMPSAAAVSESEGDSSSAMIYVPDSYPTIQAAVNAASAGDTIIVREGEYRENIDVNKRLTIKSENGSVNCIVEAEDRDDDVFEVTADYVNISGFSVKGATGWRADGIYPQQAAGIHLHFADYCSISNNTCSNNRNGISLKQSKNNSVSSNTCSNNDMGIYLDYSRNNKIRGNNMLGNSIVVGGHFLGDYTYEIDESNTVNGKPVYYWKDVEGGRIPRDAGQVILVNCTNVTIEDQNLNNASIGIQLVFSSYITIKNNNCSNNNDGVRLKYSNKNRVVMNNCSNNYAGFTLDTSNNNSISGNTCVNNDNGIYLLYSNNNSISRNDCTNNGYGSIFDAIKSGGGTFWFDDSNNGYGIQITHSNNNQIYLNNFINNANNADYFGLAKNAWNSTKEMTYTYNEKKHTNFMGNYWDDYNVSDADNDGIGDTSYNMTFG